MDGLKLSLVHWHSCIFCSSIITNILDCFYVEYIIYICILLKYNQYLKYISLANIVKISLLICLLYILDIIKAYLTAYLIIPLVRYYWRVTLPYSASNSVTEHMADMGQDRA